RLKESYMGSESLGRVEQFDTWTDPSARRQSSRLRSRLDVYYATDGLSDNVRISLPKGGYAPLFELRPAAMPAEQLVVEPLSVAAANPALGSRTMRFKLTLAGMIAAVAVPTVVAAWLFMRPVPRLPPA